MLSNFTLLENECIAGMKIIRLVVWFIWKLLNNSDPKVVYSLVDKESTLHIESGWKGLNVGWLNAGSGFGFYINICD